MTFAGQVIVGFCVSLIVTVNEQLGPTELVHVTVVAPTGKKEPDGGEHETVPQLPVVVGTGKLTTAPHWFGSFDCVTLAGQVTTQSGVHEPLTLMTSCMSGKPMLAVAVGVVTPQSAALR